MEQYKEIDNLFNPDIKKEDEVYQAHCEIVALQKNEAAILKTGIEHTDNFLIDGLSNKMIFYGARPANGKSFMCDEIIDNLTNKEINTLDVDVLRLNWEMQTKTLLLRKLKIELEKSMRDIVSTPYTNEEKEKVKKVVGKLRSPNLTNYSKIVEGEVLRHIVKKFVEKDASDGKEKVVLVDHIHILTKKDRIDSFLSICNELKLEYKNLAFVFFFQLNRELEKVWKGTRDSKPNPKNFRPHSGHIYNTDNLYQYADLICTLVIPQVVNLEEYAAVYKKSYEYLSEHFVDDFSDSDWARLKGKNRIYYDYIKNRMVEDMDEPKLFCKILDPTKETKEINVSSSGTLSSDTSMPVFERNDDIEPNFNLDDAFEEPEGVEEEPPF